MYKKDLCLHLGHTASEFVNFEDLRIGDSIMTMTSDGKMRPRPFCEHLLKYNNNYVFYCRDNNIKIERLLYVKFKITEKGLIHMGNFSQH